MLRKDCTASPLRSNCHESTLEEGAARSAYVRTTFEPPSEARLREAVAEALAPGTLRLATSPGALKRALTLRGGGGNSARSGTGLVDWRINGGLATPPMRARIRRI